MRAAGLADRLDNLGARFDRAATFFTDFIARSQGADTMSAEKPRQHFSGLITGLRYQVKDAVARARALKERGAKSLDDFAAAAGALHDVYDEVDAATAEINGTLQGEGDNGGPALADDAKNSPAASDTPAGSSEDTRAANFSDLHPSARVQTGL